MTHKIGNYQAFSIYTFNFKWVQDGKQDPNYPKWHEGLPSGRIFNSSSYTLMFKEELTQDQLQFEIDKIKKSIMESEKFHNVDNLECTKTSLKYEVWAGEWFSHRTFDLGLSDEEVLQSFEEFVQRYEHMQDHLPGNPYPENYHCLMGAEDRWRWRGQDDSPAPCRCEGCTKYGVIRINH